MTPFRSVLAVVDLSASGIHAAWRAARIARANGAQLTLLKLMDDLDRSPSSHFGPSSPVARSRSDLEHLAADIGATLNIEVAQSVWTAASPLALTQAARAADLVVMPPPSRSRWLPRLRASLPERVLRDVGVPVLIAKRPSGVNYRRMLAAIDLTPNAERVLDLVPLISPDAEVQTFHALCPVMQEDIGVAAEVVGKDPQRAAMDKAGQLMQVLAKRAGVAESKPVVRTGDPVRALLEWQDNNPAGLIVVGKARRSRWTDAVRDSLARKLLGRVRCDLLWVPTPPNPPAASRQGLLAGRVAALDGRRD